MSTPGLHYLVSLPDGEVPVGIVTFHGRPIVACQSGKIFEVVGGKEGDDVRIVQIHIDWARPGADRTVTLDLSGIQRDLDAMVQRGEAEYPGDGSVRFLGTKEPKA